MTPTYWSGVTHFRGPELWLGAGGMSQGRGHRAWWQSPSLWLASLPSRCFFLMRASPDCLGPSVLGSRQCPSQCGIYACEILNPEPWSLNRVGGLFRAAVPARGHVPALSSHAYTGLALARVAQIRTRTAVRSPDLVHTVELGNFPGALFLSCLSQSRSPAVLGSTLAWCLGTM